MTSSVEVFKCSEDTSDDGEPWRGRAVSLYQLFSLLVIPAIFTVFCYQAVIRVLWRSVRYLPPIMYILYDNSILGSVWPRQTSFLIVGEKR